MAVQSRATSATVHPDVTPSLNAPRPVRSTQRVHFLQDSFFILSCCSCVLGFFILISWLITLGVASYPHFHVEALKVSNFSVSSDSRYSGAWDAQFTVRNPNSIPSIHCDRIEVAVLYNFCSISETTTVPSFVLGGKKKTAIRARFDYTQVDVMDFYHVGHTPGESHGVIKFNLWMMLRFRPSIYGSNRLRVFCPDLQVLVSSRNQSGILIGGGMKKKCKVDSDYWILMPFREQMSAIRCIFV